MNTKANASVGDHPSHQGENSETAIDPVCGMTLNPTAARGSYPHGGRTYFFCSTHCLERFRVDPAKYVPQSAEQRVPQEARSPGATEFVCPMHPEIVRPEPGSCPICGMALEPRTATAGVLIKNAEALERFEKVDTLVVDKTGTLTEGKPRLTSLVAAPAGSVGARCETSARTFSSPSSTMRSACRLPQGYSTRCSGCY